MARISGGRSGSYDLRVWREGYGVSLNTAADDFAFKVSVKSVSPNEGSNAGGTLLSIKGRNFSPGN